MSLDLNVDVHRPLGSFVVERPGRARVFERFGLDYCCGGKKPLVEACAEKGVDVREVVREIYEEDHNQDKHRRMEEQADWSKASMVELTHHIENTHHQYLKRELPRLVQLAQKVADRHGEKRSELRPLSDAISAYTEQLLVHMQKEDTVLFPMMRELEQSDHLPSFHCGSLINPIKVMEFEHDEAGGFLTKFRELTCDYALPDDACNSYRSLFGGLLEMEADMHLHVHKENNILFPKAIEREMALQK